MIISITITRQTHVVEMNINDKNLFITHDNELSQLRVTNGLAERIYKS
jgi:hypothetical protein